MIGTVTMKQREAQVIIEIVRSPLVPVVGAAGGWMGHDLHRPSSFLIYCSRGCGNKGGVSQ
jgi:hypothetical protein